MISTTQEQKIKSMGNFGDSEMRSLNLSKNWIKKHTDIGRRVRAWQTPQVNNFDYFMIVPFSTIFYVWNSLLTLAIFYDTWMVPFSIALSFDIEGELYAIDIFAILVYIFDIFMRSRTAITMSLELSLDREKVMH